MEHIDLRIRQAKEKIAEAEKVKKEAEEELLQAYQQKYPKIWRATVCYKTISDRYGYTDIIGYYIDRERAESAISGDVKNVEHFHSDPYVEEVDCKDLELEDYEKLISAAL